MKVSECLSRHLLTRKVVKISGNLPSKSGLRVSFRPGKRVSFRPKGGNPTKVIYTSPHIGLQWPSQRSSFDSKLDQDIIKACKLKLAARKQLTLEEFERKFERSLSSSPDNSQEGIEFSKDQRSLSSSPDDNQEGIEFSADQRLSIFSSPKRVESPKQVESFELSKTHLNNIQKDRVPCLTGKEILILIFGLIIGTLLGISIFLGIYYGTGK